MCSHLRGVSSWLSSSSGSLSHSQCELRFLFLHSQLCLFPAHCFSTASWAPGWRLEAAPEWTHNYSAYKNRQCPFSHVTKLVTTLTWHDNCTTSAFVLGATCRSLKIVQFKHCMEWSQVTGGDSNFQCLMCII